VSQKNLVCIDSLSFNRILSTRQCTSSLLGLSITHHNIILLIL
jgi:hypothetical protein